ADNGPTWIRDDIDVTIPADLQEAVDEAEPLMDALDNVDPVLDVWPGQFIKMSQEDSNTVSLNDTAVMNLVMTSWAAWVTSGGVEGDWDNYVAELERSGLTENIEIHQRYFDEYLQER